MRHLPVRWMDNSARFASELLGARERGFGGIKMSLLRSLDSEIIPMLLIPALRIGSLCWGLVY